MKVSGFLSATALASTIAFAVPAWAQIAPATPETITRDDELTSCPPGSLTPCDPTQSREESETITVTGSRIRLPNVVAQEPTVTVDSAYIEQRNLTNVADALNEIPGFRGSVTPNGAQGSFGQGTNFVNALGLGTNRSLTLVNGRRVVSSNVTTVFGNAAPGTQVDLNIFPTILIDRIDTVSIGGAPVYGSDAIASTVNVILKKRFNGVEMRATSGIAEQGDNFRYSIEGVVGRDFAGGRGNITIAANYEQIDGMLYNDRDFYRQNRGNLNNPTSAQAATFGPAGRTPANDGRVNPNIGFNNSTTDGFPGSVLVNQVNIPSLTRGGLLVNNTTALRALDYNFQFDRNSDLVPFNRGILYNGAITSTAARSSGGQGYNFNDFTQITSDLRRLSAHVFANYDVTDEINLFAEGTYYRGQADQLVAGPSFNSTLFGGASAALVFTSDNPFLSAQARNLLAQNGYTSFRLSRANVDLNDQSGSAKNDLYRGVVGASSEFQLGGRDYYAEVSFNYGRNDFSDFTQGINQQNFVNAINVTRNSAGQIVCNATPTVNATPGFTPVADANCVPLNLFGEGASSQAARDYVIADLSAQSRLEQYVVNANVGGSPFDLFGNPVGIVAGFEHREEKASFQPNAFQVAGLGRSVAILPTSGSYNLDEVFGELQVPLVSPDNNLSFLYSADVFARGRYVDNTVNGGFFAWAAGGSISPVRDLKIRGNFTRSFRAPAIVELFAPRTNTFVTVPDLCNAANINTGPAPANRARNCAAFLQRYPNGTPLAASFATVPGVSGGNPVLDNEQADSFTVGLIMQPRFIPGFVWTVDYIDINLTKPISSLSATTIASACFDNTSFNATDPANGNSFCSLIRRDGQGQVVVDPVNPGVTTTYVNGQQITLEAIQSTLDYRTSLQGINVPGNLSFGGQMLFLRRRINDITGVAPARSDGVVGDPQFQGQVRVRYNTDTWGITSNVNYRGEQLISRFNRGPQPSDFREFDEYRDFITVDSSVYFEIDKKMLFTLSVTNLTNRIGQRYFDGYIPGSINDAFGRSYRASVRVRY